MDDFILFAGGILRWVHITLGVIMFSFIYYLGFLTNSFMRSLDVSEIKIIFPKMFMFSTQWLKYESLWTSVSGIVLYFWKIFFMSASMNLWSNWNICMFLGMLLTLVITWKIWFVIANIHEDICCMLSSPLPSPSYVMLYMLKARGEANLLSYLGVFVLFFMVSASWIPLF